MRTRQITLLHVALVTIMVAVSPHRVQGGEVHIAAANNDMARLRALVVADGSLVQAKDDKGRSPLHWVAISGHREAAAFLLDKGAEVDARDNDGCTPLYSVFLAAFGGVPNATGLTATVDLLLKRGADANARDLKNGGTPLHGAVLSGDREAVALLIEKGANVNAREKTQGSTPLHAAALVGDKEIAELLINKGSDVNARDTIQNATPLLFAVAARHRAVVELLIAKKADVSATMIDGRSPLDIALSTGQEELAGILKRAVQKKTVPANKSMESDKK